MTFQEIEEWYDAIAAMVKRGVIFHAQVDGIYYTIEFTGGY